MHRPIIPKVIPSFYKPDNMDHVKMQGHFSNKESGECQAAFVIILILFATCHDLQVVLKMLSSQYIFIFCGPFTGTNEADCDSI